MKTNRYKKKSSNSIIKKNVGLIQPEDYKLIPLTRGKFAKVGNEDFDKINNIVWYYETCGYAKNDNVGKMHRVIMNCPKGVFIDHINHDKLDNRRSNLRYCTIAENNFNRGVIKGGSSFKNVSWDKVNEKWRGQIVLDGKTYSVGRFKNEEDCAMAVDLKTLELHKDFAYLNFPERKEEYLKSIEQLVNENYEQIK